VALLLSIGGAALRADSPVVVLLLLQGAVFRGESDERVFDGRGARVVDPLYDDPAVAASERRVAELGAAGVAEQGDRQALFVTLKAVEAHLASAYRKLDGESRTRLPAVLRPAA
jgi:DNA-binding NarL/FixJ family response regulator